MGVILREQVVDRSHLAHQGEQVGVVEEEDMQSHLDVIASVIHPAADLAAHEGTCFVKIDLVAGIHQIHSRGQSSQTRTHDRDLHRLLPPKNFTTL